MDDKTREVVDQVANALQTALVLATRLRRNSGESVEDAIQIEASVERAAKALKRLSPEQKS